MDQAKTQRVAAVKHIIRFYERGLDHFANKGERTNHVALMSRGAADSKWRSLKTNGNFCNTMQHGNERKSPRRTAYALDFISSVMAEDAVLIEPVSAGKFAC